MTERNYTQELLKAIEFEESELAKLCIENGADVNFDLGNGWTILHETFDYAIDGMIQDRKEEPNPEIIKIIEILINKGAQLQRKDLRGETPLGLLNSYASNLQGFNKLKDLFREIIPHIDELIQFEKKVG